MLTRIAKIPRPLLIDLAGVALCLAMTGGVFVLGIRPRWRREIQQQHIRTTLRQKQRTAAHVQQTLVVTRRSLKRTEQALAHQSVRLVGLDQLNARLASLAGLADASHVEVDQLEPGEAVARKQDVAVPITLVGRGDFAAAADFLHRLHERMPDAVVGSFDLAGHPAATKDTPAACRFKLRWHAADDTKH